jgi:hypothetical protein
MRRLYLPAGITRRVVEFESCSEARPCLPRWSIEVATNDTNWREQCLKMVEWPRSRTNLRPNLLCTPLLHPTFQTVLQTP